MVAVIVLLLARWGVSCLLIGEIRAVLLFMLEKWHLDFFIVIAGGFINDGQLSEFIKKRVLSCGGLWLVWP